MASNKVALVTGANRGIGLEVVRQLAAKDWHVILSARNAEAGRSAASAIPGNVDFLEMDVTKNESIHAAARTLAGKLDLLDVLINNAGILDKQQDNAVLNISSELLLRTLTTNTVGPLRVAQAFLPLLLNSPSPRIVNVSSTGGQLATMGTWAPAYCISKTALNAVTRQLAGALAEKGLAVNSACPGWVRTEMGGPEAPGTVEQGADNIVWLATEAPQNLTGKFLRDRQPIEW